MFILTRYEIKRGFLVTLELSIPITGRFRELDVAVDQMLVICAKETSLDRYLSLS